MRIIYADICLISHDVIIQCINSCATKLEKSSHLKGVETDKYT